MTGQGAEIGRQARFRSVCPKDMGVRFSPLAQMFDRRVPLSGMPKGLEVQLLSAALA